MHSLPNNLVCVYKAEIIAIQKVTIVSFNMFIKLLLWLFNILHILYYSGARLISIQKKHSKSLKIVLYIIFKEGEEAGPVRVVHSIAVVSGLSPALATTWPTLVSLQWVFLSTLLAWYVTKHKSWSIVCVLQNMNPVVCSENTQDPSDDFTECISEFHDLQL